MSVGMSGSGAPVIDILPRQRRKVNSVTEYLAHDTVVNLRDYIRTAAGAITAAGSFQAAADDVQDNGGGVLRVPVGRFTIEAQVLTWSNMVVEGRGAGSVLVGSSAPSSTFLSAVGVTNLTFRNLTLESQGSRVYLQGCAGVKFDHVVFTGARLGGTELTPQAIWSDGSTDIDVNDCSFVDYRDNIYLSDNFGTSTDDVSVRRCRFTRTITGTLDSFTTGVYCFHVGTVLVSRCRFVDLTPGNPAGPPVGYGVYEGDGNAYDVRVNHCTFIYSNPALLPFVGVLFSRATWGQVSHCTFKGQFNALNGASQFLTFDHNELDQASVVTQATVGTLPSYRVQRFTNNDFLNCYQQPLIIMTVGAPNLDHAIVANNYFYGAVKGAVWARFVTYVTAIGNQIIDCNTTNSANDWDRGGINFYGCTDGYVSGNTIANIGAGLMHYGVVSGAGVHTINVAPSNIFRGMTTGSFLRNIPVPTTGRHEVGEEWYNWAAGAGGIPANQCVTAGTPGTWKARATLAP